ncbi:MAG: hypothetical protein GX801_10835 [Fibrobacter sp.]|nr:hypothetical protein [Fibrobacter sp.]
MLQVNAFAQRYPVLVEYELMERCISGDARSRGYNTHDALQVFCACTIEEAQKKVKYKAMLKKPERFAEAFRKAQDKCSKRPKGRR